MEQLIVHVVCIARGTGVSARTDCSDLGKFAAAHTAKGNYISASVGGACAYLQNRAVIQTVDIVELYVRICKELVGLPGIAIVV